MYDKAYRWVAEMQEISDFLEANPPSHDIYAAVARLYDYLAAADAEDRPPPTTPSRPSTACSGNSDCPSPRPSPRKRGEGDPGTILPLPARGERSG